MVSGSISLRYPRFFSPFPHGTCALSVKEEYLGLESGLPSFSPDFSCPDLLWILLSLKKLFAYKAITFYGMLFQALLLNFFLESCSPQPRMQARGLPFSPFARHYLGNLT